MRTWMFNAITAAFLGTVTFTLGGCAGYNNYPPIEGDTAFHDTNSLLMEDLLVRSMRFTLDRYPARGEFAINLPAGMGEARAKNILTRINDPRAHMMTREAAALPIYHISRVWVRGDEAEVDVQRPIASLRGPDAGPVHQTITLRLRGGLRPWRVQSSRAWTVGAAKTPRFHFINEPFDDAPAFEDTHNNLAGVDEEQ